MHYTAAFLLMAATVGIFTSVSANVVYDVVDLKLTSKDTIDLCPKLVCGSSIITLTFDVKELEAWKVDIHGIHPLQGSCMPTVTSNGISVTVSWPLSSHQCGATLTVDDTHAIYSTSMRLPPDPSQIIYREEVIVAVSCKYPLDYNVTLDFGLIPIISTTHIIIDGSGEFIVAMTLYSDAGYSIPYPSGTVSLSTKNMLYVDVKIVEGDSSQFYVLMKNCFATPTSNFYDVIKFYIIKDSCPNPADTTIHVVANGISNRGQFSVQMFKFIGSSYNLVYLHCEVFLCKRSSTCSPVCPKGRALNKFPDGKFLTIGPIEARNSQDSVGKLSWPMLLGVLLSSYFLY